MESERDPLNSKLKLDNLYINMQRIALGLGISMEGPFTQVVEGPASIDLTQADHNYGVDDTVMDSFVNWDGGLPDTSVSDSVDGESNVGTLHLSFPSHVPPSTPKYSKTLGTMTDFNRHFSYPMVADTSTNPSVGSNLHREEAATKETEPDRHLGNPNYIALLFDKRERVKNLQEETEYMTKLISQLQEQKLTYESLSDSRHKILDRIKVQLKFVQSPDYSEQEWFNAAQVITERIVDKDIMSILDKLEAEVQNQSLNSNTVA